VSWFGEGVSKSFYHGSNMALFSVFLPTSELDHRLELLVDIAPSFDPLNF
jgi:hypothetical protein